jgi:hypothetical protein
LAALMSVDSGRAFEMSQRKLKARHYMLKEEDAIVTEEMKKKI